MRSRLHWCVVAVACVRPLHVGQAGQGVVVHATLRQECFVHTAECAFDYIVECQSASCIILSITLQVNYVSDGDTGLYDLHSSRVPFPLV